MIDREGVDQKPDQIIDIADWDTHQDYEVFPVGARDKSLLVCPDPAPFDFCIPRHNYLFKEAIKSAKDPGKPRHPEQYWAELIAFRIGRLMRLTLPPVFVAIDSTRDEPGTVNEWFMGYPGSGEERHVPGGDYMQRLIPGYDREKGREHNLSTILTVSKALAHTGTLTHDWQVYWGLCLCFDALIGNTDRHQENWGLIWSEDGPRARFTPYFDNGTSLGHELQQRKMQRMMRDPNELDGYLRRGEHQMRWAKGDRRRLPLIAGVAAYCKHFPDIRPTLIERLHGWCEDDLKTMLNSLTQFDLPHPFTQERAEFVAFLTLERRGRLLQALEN
ncbi:hypothetical protein C8E00_10231 [Chromohalobacter marismortui]|uniref:Serine/threonine-protein kinase HipA n=1 Tax=Chromohalobacter marismortui TaxID=42055 RepID=A0A4R7NRD7_9GAMM|nr:MULTISPECIES: hypothetical protein [Chromohalobacter]MCI0592367.1 hypothetical protein [Chromohalobacter sp.]TDU23544.1 hypothetical protein C8E00_10231 [Chromohalobacter marismortui]